MQKIEGLVDKFDGENQAVRMFLAYYGAAVGVTVGNMKNNLEMAGFPYWPNWVPNHEHEHLTKGGAQHWIRHLFSLENTSE